MTQWYQYSLWTPQGDHIGSGTANTLRGATTLGDMRAATLTEPDDDGSPPAYAEVIVVVHDRKGATVKTLSRPW